MRSIWNPQLGISDCVSFVLAFFLVLLHQPLEYVIPIRQVFFSFVDEGGVIGWGKEFARNEIRWGGLHEGDETMNFFIHVINGGIYFGTLWNVVVDIFLFRNG